MFSTYARRPEVQALCIVVLNSSGSTDHREFYLNELVIQEIRNSASEIFQNFVSSCCKIEIRAVVVKIPEVSAVRGWIIYRRMLHTNSVNYTRCR